MGAADRIAETILRQGQIQAEGLQRSADIQARAQQNNAQIWSGALQSLGQIPGEIAKYKLADTENKVRQAQLAEHQKQQDDQFNANQIFQFTTRPDPDGTVKLDDEKLNAMMQKAQGANIDFETQSRMSNAFKQMNADGDTFRQQQLAHQVKVAQNVMSMVKPGEQLTPGVALAVLKLGQANGWATAADTEQFMGAVNQGHDPAQLFAAIIKNGTQQKPITNAFEAGQAAGMTPQAIFDRVHPVKEPDKPAAPKPFTNEIELRQDAATQGTSAETPTAWQSVETLRQLDADKAKPAAAARGITNEVELAQDAATLGTPNETPTARQSKTALDRLRPVKSTAPEPGTGPLPGANIPDVAPGQKNDAFLKTLPPPVADKVKAVVEGRVALPARIQKGDTYWQSVLDAAVKYDPSFDAVNYNARSKTRADFTSGKSAQQVNALNTAIGHMDRLLQVTDALGNFHEGSLGPLTTTANEVKNWFSQKFGSKEIPAFNVVRKAVSDELTRVWRQAGGSEQDIQENLKNLASSNTPEQLYGAVGEFGHLLESKLDNLKEQYRQGMGTDPINMVTPEARRVLDKVEGKSGGKSSGVSVTAPNGQTYNFPTASDAAAFKARAGIK